MNTFFRGALRLRLLAGLLVLGASSTAQAYTYSVLIDSDNDPATGCSVATPAGPAVGIDARVDAVAAFEPPNVQNQTLRLCEAGSFGTAQSLQSGYPVGFDRAPGPADVIELGVERALLGEGIADDWRLVFLAQSPLLGAIDVAGPVTAVGLGQPPTPPPLQRAAIIPASSAVALALLCIALAGVAVWTLRRHPGLMVAVVMIGTLSLAGIAWAAGYQLDGEISDWDEPALLNDPTGDPTAAEPQVDITAVFADREGGRVFFRFDVVETRLPVLVPPFLITSFNLNENSANTTLVGSINAAPGGLSTLLRFTLDSQAPSAAFSVDNATGAIRVTDASQLDFETRPVFTLGVSVSLQGAPGFSLARTVTINLNDLNEAPQIADQSFQVLETAANGDVVGALVASDVDAGANGQLSYSVLGGSGQSVFAVNASSGQITVANAAGLIVAGSPYTLQVQVSDAGAPALTDTAIATIAVTNINDAPSFTPGPNVSVNEDSAAFSAPWATAINDNDDGTQTLTFEFTANSNAALFAVAPAVSPTGVLTFTPAANANGVANLRLRLRDNGGTASGGVDVSPAVNFSVTVTAVNDVPSFVIPATAPTVLENAGAQTVAAFASAISAGPADESGQNLSFAVNVTGSTGSLAFSTPPAINPATGALTYTAQNGTIGVATVSVVLSDNGGTANGGVDTSAAQVFTLEVANVNDAPSFTPGPNVSVNEDSTAFSAPWATAINDNDGGTQTLTFEFTANSNAALFAVAPAISPTGVLSFTPAANVNGVANLSVLLRDSGGTAFGGSDTSAVANFSISVTAVNDVPSFVIPATAPTVLENAGAQTVAAFATAISAGPADESGQTLSFAVNVTGSTGSLAFSTPPAINPATGALTYTAQNGTIGVATVSVVLSDNGGTANGGVDTSAAQVFTLEVANVNDAPSFTPGPNVSVNEDSTAFSAPWATAINDNDGGSQTLSFEFTANSNAGLFAVAPAISPTGVLSFTPAANANGVANLSVLLRDSGGTAFGGSDTSTVANFSITVTAVNDAPAFVVPALAPTSFQDGGPQTVAGFASAISAGPADEAAQALTFELSITGTTGGLSFAAAPSIDPATGTLTYTAAAGGVGTATVSAVLRDNGGTANGGVDASAAQVFSIEVANINDAPSFTAGPNVTVNEDSAAFSAPWATAINDNDGGSQTLSFEFTANSNAGLFAVAPAISPTGVLTFTPAANANGVANLSVLLRDNGGTAFGGSDTSTVANFSITVTAVNDAPLFTVPSTAPSVLENAGAQVVAGFATGISAGPADESGQTVSFAVNVTGTTGNLAFTSAPALDPITGNLSYTAAADTSGVATISVVLSDNGGTANGGVDASAAQVFTLEVLFVNTAPSFVGGGDISVNEDSGAFSAAWASAIEDGDPGVTQALNFVIQSNSNAALFSALPAISPAGVLSFTPAANANGSATLSVVLQDDGGTANGGVDTSSPAVSYTITVLALNDAPVVTPPTNVAVTRHIGRSLGSASAESLLANVSDPADGAGAAPFSVTVQTNAATTQGGRVTVAADGSWSYQPPAGAVLAADSFNFQVCDSGLPLPPACTTATATIALSGTAVWFVDAAAPAGGDGTLARPFNTIAPAAAAAGVNGRIFVASGSYGAGTVLLAGQWLIGQGVSVASAASFDGLFGLTPPAGSATRPTIGGTRPLITSAVGDAITLATGNSLRGVEIGNTAAIGLVGGNFGTLTLGDNRISGSGQALSLTTGTLAEAAATTAFDQISSSSGASNIVLSAVAGSANFGTGALSGATGTAFQFSTGTATLTYAGSIAKASAGRMIDIDGAGAANLTLSGDLTCSATCGSGAGNQGLRISGRTGGTIILNGANKVFTSTSTNPAVQLVNNTGASIAFSGNTSLGISGTPLFGSALVANGGGTLSLNGVLSIETAAARSLQLSGMTLSGSMSGTIVSNGALGAGIPAIDIQSSTSPTGLSFEQQLIIDHDDGGESGGGINLVGNTGSYNFSNFARITSANTAALRASNAGTVTLGSLGAGPLVNNAGIAVDVQNTTIGAAGLNAVAVQALGGANGILLNNTGSAGGLVITGAGGTCTSSATCTGGYIANTTSHGIQLTNTLAPSITRMRIENTGGSGISGTEVNGFSFASGSIDGSGTAGGVNTSNIAFNTSTLGTERNVYGVVSITDSNLSNARYHGIDLFNFNGTLSSVTITGNTLTSSTSSATSLGSGVRLIAFGSASTVASVTRASIANNTVLNFPGGSAIRAQGGNANVAGPVGSFGNAGNATNVIAITGNRMQGASAANRFAGEAIVTVVDGRGEGNFDVSNNGTALNPVQHSTGTVITNSAFGDSTATATVNNNRMSANNSFGSQGIGFGTSFTTGFTTTPTLAITTNNNTIQNVDGNGILGVARDASATLTARIQNNVVAAPLGGVRPGIRVDSGNAASGDEDVCVRIDGNTSAGSGGTQGIGLRKQGAVTTTHDFRVHAMAAVASPGVETHVNGQNPAGNGTLLISATSGFSSCNLP
jgi:hypothetical protein